MDCVEYQFQMAAIAELDGEVFVGQRSMSILTVIRDNLLTTTHADTSIGTYTRDLSIAVVVTFLLTIILYTAVLLVGLGLCCTCISTFSSE